MSDEQTPNRERVAFEPFGTLDGVLSGQPFRIFPTGTWYRGDRKLNLTEDRLLAFAENAKRGLPRYRIPINIEHEHTLGKYGTIKAVDYLPNGEDGPGLYATDYELTDEGRQWIQAGKADAVSGEAIWTLNGGAKYQDPQTGEYHDNVLAGVALTATPFFGQDVNLFSANPDAPRQRGNGFTALVKRFKAWVAEMEPYMRDTDGDGVPDEMPEMPDEMPAKMQDGMSAEIPVADAALEVPAADAATGKGAETMAEEQKIDATPPAAPEPMTTVISAEEFAALKDQLAAEKKAREDFAAKYAAEKQAHRLEQLKARVDRFVALDAADTLAEKLAELERVSPDLFTYFENLLETADKQIAQGALFAQRGTGRKPEPQGETLADVASKIVADKFGGDMTKYGEAWREAAKQRPDLETAYLQGAPLVEDGKE